MRGRGWGTREEERAWADGKHPVTQAHAQFLASWAKRVLEEEVAEDSSGHVVFGAVGMALAYGRERLDWSGIQSLGIDRIAWGRGHRPLILDWFRAKRPALERRGRGLQRQTDYQKGLQFPDLPLGWKSRFIMHLAPLPEPKFTHKLS